MGEDRLISSVVDSVSGVALFGTNTSPGQVVKLQLPSLTRIDALTLPLGENHIAAAVIDPRQGFAYFGTRGEPGHIVKVRVSDLTRMDALNVVDGDLPAQSDSAVIDPQGQFAVFGAQSFNPFAPGFADGRVVKVRLSDFTKVASATLSAGQVPLTSAAIDPEGLFVYFGTNTVPGKVIKVRVADLSSVGVLTLNDGENNLTSAVMDPKGEFALFGTNTTPGRVVKVRVSDLTRVATIALNQGEDHLRSAVLDTADGTAIFGAGDPAFLGMCSSPGVAVRVRMSDFARVSATPFGPGVCAPVSAIVDPPRDEVLFGTDTEPGMVASTVYDTVVGRIPRVFAPLIINQAQAGFTSNLAAR